MRLLMLVLPLLWVFPAEALTPPIPEAALAKPAAAKKKPRKTPVKKKTATAKKTAAKAPEEPKPSEPAPANPKGSSMSARKRARVMRGADTLTFARDKVTIVSPSDAPEAVTAPAGKDAKDDAKKNVPSAIRHEFNTDIRSEESLETDGLYSLEHMEKDRATLVLMKKPHPLSLPHAKLYKPVDILIVGADGTILAIMPQIVLATLEKQVTLEMQVKGLLYINGGEAAEKQIEPKDRLDYRAFVADPTVLQ